MDSLLSHTTLYSTIYLFDPDISSRDHILESQGVSVRSGDANLEINNIYIPPVTCQRPYISGLLTDKNRNIIGGKAYLSGQAM